MRRDSAAARSAVPVLSPPLFAPTDNRPEGCGHPPTYEPPSQSTQHPLAGSLGHPLSLWNTRTTHQEWYHFWMELPPTLHPLPFGGVQPASVVIRPFLMITKSTSMIKLFRPAYSLTATDRQISTSSLLAYIQYSSVSKLTEGEDNSSLFDHHCKLYRFDDGISKEHGVGQSIVDAAG